MIQQSRDLLAEGADGWQPVWAVAAASASLGRDDALDRIDEALEVGVNFTPIIAHSPAFDALRGTPAFQERMASAVDRIAQQRRVVEADRLASLGCVGEACTRETQP